MTAAVERNLVRHGIERIQGRARFLSPRQVEVEKVGGEHVLLEADVVLLASGWKPRHSPNIPMDDPDVCDSENILEIGRAPESLLVIGSGAAGCEYASIFAALGTRVTIVGGSHLLPALDVEMAGVLAECFNSMGIRVIPRLGSWRRASWRRAQGHARRRPHTASPEDPGGRGAAPAGRGFGTRRNRSRVRLGRLGPVDQPLRDHRCGGVRRRRRDGPPGLAAAAMEQARVAICHAFGFEFKRKSITSDRLHLFHSRGRLGRAHRRTGPDRRHRLRSRQIPFGTNAKAQISGFPDGLVKLVFRVSDKVLLGVHIVGELASELIHIGQFVIQAGGTIDRFIDATFAVPTRSEAYKYAAYDGLMRLARRTEWASSRLAAGAADRTTRRSAYA